MKKGVYKWAALGDINAFFGLMLDNIAGLILAIAILHEYFQFPVEFAIRYMVPGTALGVLFGDLMFFVLAFYLAGKTRRSDVTAMPLGLDTPSTIGMAFFVLGPAYSSALESSGGDQMLAATSAWHIGIWSMLFMGLIKLVLSFFSGWVRRSFPRAGLLGSLTAIALGLIAFTQLPKIMANPIPGFASLAIVLVALIGKGKLPLRVPGALAAVAIGTLLWHLMRFIDSTTGTELLARPPESLQMIWLPLEWLTVFQFRWLGSLSAAVEYLPYIIPFAIATVIGGIDCTESAASAGDSYSTRTVIGVEALATILAGVCGGVIQTTPFIGHPAYKFMGGRAAYTLATALFVGLAGVLGYFSLMFILIPEAAVLPILIFIGLEITAQSFHATPRRHYAALALACLPTFAKLIMIYLGQFLGVMNFENMPQQLSDLLLYLGVLAGGFIISSLLWSAALAEVIDRKFYRGALYLVLAAVLTAFGVVHSPLPGDKMFLLWNLEGVGNVRVVCELMASYLIMALIFAVIGGLTQKQNPPINSDEEFERLT
ncbi:MAG: permease [Pirellulaceae bacterium]|nr:permease [Pirellulaceae bacterium]